MARLLVVHHTPSPAMQELLEAALAGARDPALAELGSSVEVATRPALTAGPVDALSADGYLLGTPANIGYISGALKHFFDTIYYPSLEATRGRAFGAWVHGNLDTTGAVRALDTITGGLQWQPVRPVIEIVGQPSKADRAAVRDLASLVTVMVAQAQ
jgi:NAD(P)H-dependent FMN reductase